MTTPKFLRYCIPVVLFTAIPVYAQSSADDIVNSAANQNSLLPRIYATDVTISSPAHDRHVTGSFVIRNSEDAAVGNIQYETMLLSPLQAAPVGQLVADAADVYDRIRSQGTITLKAGEKRTIPFTYDAPSVPEGSYRIRIQIITTNDRKLGWDDASLTLGGANGFVVIGPTHVNVASTDPVTKETNSSWEPLYGVNVDPRQRITLTANMDNPGTEAVSGTVGISTKRLLYANETPVVVPGPAVSVPAHGQKTLSLPLTTQTTPGAYIILITIQDASNHQVSGVAEYRYVVRGKSASVASVKTTTIPASEGGLAQVDFVVGGSADRATPVAGNMHVEITDNNGVVGEITKDFSVPAAIPVSGSARITMKRTLCGTPLLHITLTSDTGSVLDSYTEPVQAFANPSCKKPIFTLPVINTLIGVIALILITAIYRLRKKIK